MMEICLDRVGEEQRDLLFRLLQYSLYEESATDMNEMNEEGIYEYKYFSDYFSDKGRDAFIVRSKDGGKVLGFVMINEHVSRVQKGHSIAEFMILPKYRKNGIGKQVAFRCFDMYLGDWEVSPSYGSEKAYLFWKNVIDEYTLKDNRFEDGVFVFKKEDNH